MEPEDQDNIGVYDFDERDEGEAQEVSRRAGGQTGSAIAPQADKRSVGWGGGILLIFVFVLQDVRHF